ncbi:MAG TPA: hypothetical protein PLL78_00730 [Fimbriimonadaceae bacterium]|nr:hypothetical protein [Fimbriimonadaceae bacterium]HRJ95187.1 hypothetical protein [Fimbriimonadaceae bacterium]
MDFVGWNEAVALLGGATASAFAIVRLGMAQQRALVERLIAFLQSHLERQSEGADRIAGSLDGLATRVSDNTTAVQRLLDRVVVTFRQEER